MLKAMNGGERAVNALGMEFDSMNVCSDVYEVPLTRGGFALVDIADKPLIDAWGFPWHVGSRGYVQSTGTQDGVKRVVRLHRLILGFPRGMIDHRDLDKLNNMRSNLRVASNSQNQANRGPTKHSSRYKGVHINAKTGRAEARLVYQGTHFYLGTYGSEEQAARVYDAKAIELFGEFARLNFPLVS